jgi:hypothetical protein
MKQIKLTQGYYAIVDDVDYEWLSQYKWYIVKNAHTNYAISWFKINGIKKHILMHRLILNAPNGMQVDHKDHNGLNNTRENIRLCSNSENGKNKKGRGISKYLGVSVLISKKNYINKYGIKKTYLSKPKYIAEITINGKKTYLGSFQSEIEAAKSYNEYAKIHHKEFAKLNVLPSSHNVI